MRGVDWHARLKAQGVSDDIIENAKDTAQRQAARIDALPSDPLSPIDVQRFQARLRTFTRGARHVALNVGETKTPGPIEDIGQRLDAGEVSVSELVEEHLAALTTIGGKLNVSARLEPDAARDQARSTEKALAALKQSGHSRPPLFGIPMAHKDLYSRAGWKMEAGSAILRGHVADETSTAVEALDRAGSLDLGRLNTVEFALGPDGRNAHTGSVRNPWNPEHVTGGSSSGSGSAVAACLVPVALGSDTGGSIRMPAAACGVVGLKPTAGLIGRRGIWPLSASLDTAGPLGGGVRDVAMVTQVMAGYDPADPQSVDMAATDLMQEIEDGFAGIRVGFAERPFLDPVTPEIADAIAAACKLMASEGAKVSSVDMSEIEVTNMMNVAIVNAEAATQHRRWLATRALEYGSETLGRLIAGLFLPADSFLAALTGRAAMLDEVLDTTFAQVDIVATPVWPADPPKIDGDDAGAYRARVEFLGHCTRPFNYLGLPALVLPCGLSKAGLPIALQLVARPFEEGLLLRAARAYERARAFREEHQALVRADI